MSCKGETWTGWGWARCGRAATRDGYCGTHHPDAVAKRKAKSDRRTAEKIAAIERRSAAHREERRKLAAFDGLLAAARAVRATCPADPDINPRWNTAWDSLIAAIDRADSTDQEPPRESAARRQAK